MSTKTAFRMLIVVAVLLAACAFSLDAFRNKRCDERGGEWKSVDGTIQCVMPK